MRNQSFHLKMNDFPDCESLEAHADERSRLQFRVSTFPLNCVIINIDLSNGRGGGSHMTLPVPAESTAIFNPRFVR